MIKFKRLLAIFLFVVMVTACLAGCGQQASPTDEESPNENEPENVQPEKEIKVALLCSGPINDGGWNTDAYNGLMNVGKSMGGKLLILRTIAADIPNVLRNYASNGFR